MKNHATPQMNSAEQTSTHAAARGATSDVLGAIPAEAYDDLRVLARRWLAREQPAQLLQTTALVHEAYLRLLGDRGAGSGGPDHYLALASMAMRRILVDEARAARRGKRGAGWTQVPLGTLETTSADTHVDLSDLDEAMTRLMAHDERKCRVVEMRFFGGLSNARIASALGITERTVERDWQYARAWLYRELAGTRTNPRAETSDGR